MADTPYKPIDCSDYDIYEIAIMQNRQLIIESKTDEGDLSAQKVKPIQLQIIDGAEYLFFISEQKDEHKIRLDRINSAKFND